MLLMVQHFLGLGLVREVALAVEEFERDGLAWRVSLPSEVRDDPVVVARAVVLEDGQPIGLRAASNREVRELGRGRYHIRGNSLRLAPFDQSDPLTNGRQYALRHPVRVAGGFFAGGWAVMLLAWGFVVCRRERALVGESCEPGLPELRRRGWWARLPDKSVSMAVLGSCAVVAVTLWTAERPFSDRAFSIKGLPYSDANGWNHMAEQIAAGDQAKAFWGQRRFFPWMLAGVYVWTGPWLASANVVQLVFLISSGVLVYALATPLSGSRWLGAAAGLATVASPILHALVHVPMTEPCGLVFALTSILLLWYAVVNRRLWLVALAGVVFALGNLATPFTFFAAPFYAFVVWICEWRAERRLWRSLRAPLVLTIAVSAVYLPWMAFQKTQLGSFTFSSNTAGLLYGAVSADGVWGGAMFEEAREAGVDGSIAERDSFFMRRLRETVREDPGAYVRMITRRAAEFLNSLERLDRAPAVLAMLGLLGLAAGMALRRNTLGFLLAWPALAWLAWWSYGLPPWVMVAASSLVLVAIARGRNWVPLALILSTALAVILINALSGNLMPRRGWVFFDWLLLTLWLAALGRLMLLAGEFLESATSHLAGTVAAGTDVKNGKPSSAAAPGSGVTGTGDWPQRGTLRLPAAVVMVLLLIGVWVGSSTITLGIRKIAGPVAPAFTWDENLGERILAGMNAPAGAVARLLVLTDQQAELQAGEDVGHYSRAFDRQDQLVTVVRPIQLHPDSVTQRSTLVRFAGSLEAVSKTEPVLLVAVRSFDDTRRMGERWLYEALALVPLKADQEGRLQPDPARVIEFEPLEPAAGNSTPLELE